MRKKASIFLFSTIILFSFSISTEATGNSEMPDGVSGKKAGRSLHLIEAQRITDYDGDFIFRRIRGIKVAVDGSVYIRCRDHLYKFTSEGKLVRNYITKGEGPGEVKYFVNFDLSEKSIWVGAVYPVKLIRFSKEVWNRFIRFC